MFNLLLINQSFVYNGVQFGCLVFPLFINVICRLFIGYDKLQFQHGLNGGKDLQKNGVSAVFVLIVVRLAFLLVAELGAVVFYKAGNFFPRAFGNIDIN